MGLTESTSSSNRVDFQDVIPNSSAQNPLKTQKTYSSVSSGNDNSGRVSMLADGSFAFYNKNNFSVPTSLDCHSGIVQKNSPLLEIVETDVVDSLQQISDVPLEETPVQGTEFEDNLNQLLESLDDARRTELRLSIEEDGRLIRGWIRINMNLKQPLDVRENVEDEKPSHGFHSSLQVTSETTTNEVIESLLKKNKIFTSARKFALYERFYEHGQTTKVLMRRLGENEKPLVLALRWTKETEFVRKFLLQENETGDILWEAFTLPELTNFLKILDREEEEYIKMIQQKYKIYGEKLQETLKKFEKNK